jgi:hypothetical protein
MRREYNELATYERDGYTIIVDKTWEDVSPRDLFDDSVTDIDKMCQEIDSGLIDWFMLRVRVLVDEFELGSHYVGGCLYEDAREVLADGLAEDMISEALAEAKSRVHGVYKRFQELSFAVDREGITA